MKLGMTVTLREFALLARYEMPLAASLAALIFAYGEIGEADWGDLNTRTETFEGWDSRLQEAFEASANGRSYGALQSNVIGLAKMSRAKIEKVAN